MIKLLVHLIHVGERLYADYITSFIVHNILVHHIVNSYPIDVVLEKHCITYIWNLTNSGCKLHADIVIFQCIRKVTSHESQSGSRKFNLREPLLCYGSHI